MAPPLRLPIPDSGQSFHGAGGLPRLPIGAPAGENADRQEESRALLQELAAHREEVKEEERRRIARDLHEELGQLLTSLRMGISLLRVQFGADHAPMLEKLPSLLALVDKSIDGLRRTVADLRPTPLDIGIVPALEWLARDFSQHTGIDCPFLGDEGIHLPDDRATALFRIVQEALNNVARHAGARRAEVVLQRLDDGLLLRIRDDGHGFDPLALRSKSFGLLGMWERAQTVGGELDIRSAANQGSEVILRIPA